MRTLKIVLFGPPASGKSAIARLAAFRYPNDTASFEMEGVGKNEQAALFQAFCSTMFSRHFVLSPASITPDQTPFEWKKVFLLPRSAAGYYQVLKRRRPGEAGKFEEHYDRFAAYLERFKDKPNVLRVDGLRSDFSDLPVAETLREIRRKLEMFG